MNIMCPGEDQIPALRQLWKDAFGDEDDFLDIFYGVAFAPERCRCILEGDRIAAALYWFDCECDGAKLAYLYGVATAPDCRGRGLCRALMADTARHLEAEGYQGIVLVPQKPGLIRMYAGMGYTPCGGVTEFHVMAGEEALPMRKCGPTHFSRRRRALLPPGGVIQEGVSALFLAAQTKLRVGDGWTAAVTEVDGMLWCPEFLGDPALAPGLVKALGYREGSFRVPGSERPFAMFRPLSKDCPQPAYFGLAFD